MKQNQFVRALFAALFVLCVIPMSAEAQETFSQETKASGFVLPTSFSFIDETRVIVGEKAGAVYMVDTTSGDKELIYTVPSVNTFNDRGLIGVTAHNDFLTNGLLYLSYTHDVNPSDFTGPKTARIVRVVYDFTTQAVDPDSYTVLVGSVVGTPAQPSCDDHPVGSDCIASNSGAHSAGGLRFGPDGYLYASIGDGSDFYTVDPHALNSLDPDYLTGKILRLNADGTAAAGNPYYEVNNPTSNRSKVFASGIRNSFRFDFMENGDLVAGEVGWSGTDEINLVTKGANFGWPCYEGSAPQGGYSVVFPTECAQVNNHSEPIYEHSYPGSFSLTGGDEATSPTYGSYAGKYFFGDYSQNVLLVADYDNHTITNVEEILDNPAGPVDIQIAPDGTVYFLAIYTGELRRIVMGEAADTNQAPTAVFYVDQELSDAPATAIFNAGASFDPEGDDLTYTWDFGDGVTGTGVAPSHTYQANGSFSVVLTVTDPEGLMGTYVGSTYVGMLEYDANPSHVSTVITPTPVYVGLNADLVTTFTNVGGGDDDYILYREIYTGSGQRIYTDNEIIPHTETGDITRAIMWLPPGIDDYRVVIAFFSTDWRNTYEWNNEALLFSVEERDLEDGGENGDSEASDPECIDWDGDGWGWDGEKGCLVETVDTEDESIEENNDKQEQSSDCPVDSDHDGDGWGWNGTEGCLVTTDTQEEEEEQSTTGECIDWDGDGWGWDGEKGCLVETVDTEDESIEENNDKQEQSSDCPVDSDHDGDGWGWDGEKGCLV